MCVVLLSQRRQFSLAVHVDKANSDLQCIEGFEVTKSDFF
jgi:hypothetical protein